MTREFAWFAMAGVVGLLVDIGTLYIGRALGLGYYSGRACSFLAAVLATWQINRRLTFTAGAASSAWSEWWTYLVAMSGGGLVNYATYSVVIDYGTRLFPSGLEAALPAVGVIVGSLAGMVVNFSSAKWWVFRRA
jgi:putative flippase GtrA